MKFQFYIINLEEGTVEGTNDVEKLDPYIVNDEYLILTAQHGSYWLGSRKDNDVQELDTSDQDGHLGDDSDEE